MAQKETPLLLRSNLKALRLPTMLAEYGKLAGEATDSNQDYLDYLLRLTELELATRSANALQAQHQTGRLSRCRRTSMHSTLARRPASRSPRFWSWPAAAGSISVRTAACWGVRELEKPAQRNTPLVTEECEGQVTVTDPAHPLFGRTFQLAGIARLPGAVR